MAKKNQVQSVSRDSPESLRTLAREMKVGQDALRTALVNVAPADTDQLGNNRWTIQQAEAALQASGSRGAIGPLKDQKLQEHIRQLQIANDMKAGKLVARAFVAAAIARAQSRIAQARVESEAQDPLSLEGKDRAGLREGVAKIWDKVGTALAACAEDFREPTKPTKGAK